VTAAYTVNGARVTLIWNLAPGETAVYNGSAEPSGDPS